MRVFNTPQVTGILWLKDKLVHSGHLHFVHGRQATEGYKDGRLVRDRRYRSDVGLRALPQ